MMSRPERGPFIGSMSRVVWQWVRKEIHRDVVAAGYDDLNPAHVAAFRYPGADGMRPVELADDMQITKQSVNELLGHLERHGYLVREPDPADNRGRRIRLTGAGRELEDVVFAAAARAERSLAERVGPRRFREFRQVLVELSEVLDQHTAGISPAR